MEYQSNETTHAVGEVKLTYTRREEICDTKVRTSADINEVFQHFADKDTIEFDETAAVISLDAAQRVTSYYVVSIGGQVKAQVDIRKVMCFALLTNAKAIALCHNHPSGSLIPSKQDDELTNAVRRASVTLDISLLDHVIITKNSGYYSYADHGRI